MSTQLTVSGLTKRFGGLVALDHVDLTFDEGELVGLIGPNGSGKTTLLNVISGYYAPNAGSVHFAGRRIDGRGRGDSVGLQGGSRPLCEGGRESGDSVHGRRL